LYYDPAELPSLEQIKQMDRLRDKALDAVEISIFEPGELQHVKCQRCSNTVPIVAKLHRPKNDRVVILQRRIKWIEDHYHNDKAEDLKAIRAEKRRGIPLQYWRVCAALVWIN
jgi:hypothetical protein